MIIFQASLNHKLVYYIEIFNYEQDSNNREGLHGPLLQENLLSFEVPGPSNNLEPLVSVE